ncbi:MAG: hypothetical protein JSS36_05760 [Proteobacteria bacterium]|nr:hypothetical protein [Pseudomonadota bacterium]
MAALYHIVPMLGAAIFIIAIVIAALRPAERPPAVLAGIAAAAFTGWSVLAVSTGGITGFWDEHVRNAWSNQIWLDLLCAGALAFAVLAPRARAVGMQLLPWGLLVIATGSVGLLAMATRCFWLEAARAAAIDGEG